MARAVHDHVHVYVHVNVNVDVAVDVIGFFLLVAAGCVGSICLAYE